MNPKSEKSGILYIVATPIGNLDDITERAIKTLTEVDLIACEDTRHSGRLLANYGIKNRLMSFHQHNENESSNKFIDLLLQGNDIALISDAGTPLISDPGYPLVNKAHQEDIKVVPIVGACAIIALLSCSGLPTISFQFQGFLSAKTQQRQQQLQLIAENTSTTIIYESTHRILKCLQDMLEILGEDRKISVGRELTKTFETIKLGTVSEIKHFIESDSNQQKGEFVIAISGSQVIEKNDVTDQQKQLMTLLAKELPPKKAAKITAEFLKGKTKAIYNYFLQK
ncbi:MAG: 16S rRNA (cytidine(1402)-2'-O)-methyltransferase [Marinicellaceae bacterium]